MGQKDRTSAPPGTKLVCLACGGNLCIQFIDGAWTLACFPLNVPCGPVIRNVDANTLVATYLKMVEDPTKIDSRMMVPRKVLKGGITLKLK